MQPVIPLRKMIRKPKPAAPRRLNKPQYTRRDIIERMFGWLKDNHLIGNRYDNLADSFSAMVSLDCSLRCLRQLVSYRVQTSPDVRIHGSPSMDLTSKNTTVAESVTLMDNGGFPAVQLHVAPL